MRRRWAAALALAILVGCGGSEPLSRAEYAAEGNEICREVAARWEVLEPPAMGDPVTEEAYAELMVWDMRTGNELGGEVLDRVGALRPPSAMQDDAGRMLDALGRVVDALDSYAAAAETGDQAELARLDEEVDDDDQAVFEKAARALGLKTCARGLFLSSWRVGATETAPQEELDAGQPLPSPSLNDAGK